MYCTTCAASLDPGATFCGDCGTRVAPPVRISPDDARMLARENVKAAGNEITSTMGLGFLIILSIVAWNVALAVPLIIAGVPATGGLAWAVLIVAIVLGFLSGSWVAGKLSKATSAG